MHQRLNDALKFAKDEGDSDYTDLMGKRLADMACNGAIGCLLLAEAGASAEKRIVAEKFIRDAAIQTAAHYQAVTSGNDIVLREYERLLRPDLPVA